MDFRNLRADVELYISKHFTPGRCGCRIEFVGIHHTAAVGLTVRGCYGVWQTRPASAHYLVQSDGVIGQLVRDRDTAWALGDFDANCRSVNIEHANNGANPWTVSEACLDSGAHLVAALCHAYGLGRPVWGRNVRPHKAFAATACPGELAGSQRDAYTARAQYYYDLMAAGGAADTEDEVTDQDIEKIAQRVWGIQQGRETHDRCYRMTSMLKAMCGIGAEDTTDPKDIAGEVYKRTIDRWARCTAMLKAMCGIPKESVSIGDVPEKIDFALSDEDVERIAERVAKIIGGR